MNTVETMVAALADGQGGCLALEGAEGFGKTTLLAYAANLAAELGIDVARGAATQLDYLAPLSTLKTTFDQCTSTRCTLEQLGAETTTTTLIERLGDQFEQLAVQKPLLVGIDDVHHADELTTLALRMLVPGLMHMPVLWLLSRRPAVEHPSGQDTLEFLLQHHARRMTLPALSDSESAELCAQLTEARPGPRLRSYSVKTGGDPRLLAELVRTLDREGRILRTDGISELLDDGTDDEAAFVQYTRRVLTRPDVSRSTRANLIAEQAYALTLSSSPSDAEQPGQEAVDLGEGADRPAAVALGSVARSVAAWSKGELTKAHDAAQTAVHAADLAGSHAVARHPRLLLAPTLTALDRFDEAAATLTQCHHETSTLDTAWPQGLLRLQQAELQLSSGRLHDAAAVAEVGLDMIGDNPNADTARLLATLGEVEIRQGQLSSAGEYIDRALGLTDRAGHKRGHVVWRKALLQEAEGHLDAAARTVTTFYAIRPHLTEVLASSPAAATTLVRLARQGGAIEEARHIAGTLQDISRRNPEVISLAAAAAHAQGLVSTDSGALGFAADLFRYSPRPLARAAALEDAGRAEIESGERDRGQKLLAEGASTWSACHATLDAKRTRDTLDSHEGQQLGSTRPGAHGSDGPSSTTAGIPNMALADLTLAEKRVGRLVAQGMTNRQIASALVVSPHTVDSHLRHSFSKLNVASRVELTRVFLTQDQANNP